MMLKNIIMTGLLALGFTACQTAQQPAEYTAAKEALNQAESEDLNNSMPRAIELAERKLDEAEDLLDKAEDKYGEGKVAEADIARQEAIQLSKEVQAIAKAGMELKSDVDSFDQNLAIPGAYNLTAENRNLQQRITILEADLVDAQRAMQNSNASAQADGIDIATPVAYFNTGKAEITEKFTSNVRELAEMLKKNANYYVTLEGYADPRGSEAMNRRLSEERAQAVSQELVSAGIDRERIEVVAKGETSETEASNDADIANLQLDRKVVAKLTTVAH